MMFQKAQPIWLKGKSRQMNTHAVFRTVVDLNNDASLHITGFSFYRIFINGIFLGFGPARTAKGYAREDIIKLNEFRGKCEILIEMVGYYCSSLSTVKQTSYLMAEVECNGKVISYTGKDFQGFSPNCKVQNVERYSVQRHFTEVWDYRKCTDLTADAYSAYVEVLSEMPQVLDRVAPYPAYNDILLTDADVVGRFVFDETLPYKQQYYSWKEIPETWGNFRQDHVEHHAYQWVQRQRQSITEKQERLPIVLKQGQYVVFDFKRIEVGFLKAYVEALEESNVVIAFSEYYEEDTFKFSRIKIHNAMEFFFPEQDKREVMSFEPYTFRFVMVAVKEGSIRLHSFGTKTYIFDTHRIHYQSCENKILDSICRGAIRTFAHNAVDLYMDCPSRERAGWLCDSYFMAKTEYMLTGETKVEDAFLENYRLFQNDGEYPKGVLPMCYPSDADMEGKFIPQWMMWYVLEVEEYLYKRGHEDMKELFRESVYGVLEFFKQYENEEGLLERLPSWNFVEWSKANLWTWDVNYPTNFLYSKMLACIGKIYGDMECKTRSEEVRKVAIEQSFNGTYFLDHAIRDEYGKLCIQDDSSEACQYYAILFGNVDIHDEKYSGLKNLVLNVFMPSREENVMPEIMRVNAFIGAYLRLEALCKMKEYQLALNNIEEFFESMEERTGTLWEFRELIGSHDHGFASYVYSVINEALRHI